MFICSIVAVYSINLFAPTIVKQFDPTASVRHIQALVIPIFLASAVGTLAVSYASDKLKHRYGFAMFGWVLTLIGLVIMINQRRVSTNTKYGALYLISVGGYISVPQLWTLLVNNCSGAYKIAFAIAIEMGLGNVGGIISSMTFQGSAAPFYDVGYKVNLGLVCAAMAMATAYVGAMWWENKQREEGRRDYLLQSEEADNLGDDHPHFRYGF
jgi:sugar phosphate permease